MSVDLDGGCMVSGLREGQPSVHGKLRIWERFGRATGTDSISLRILELAAGTSPVLSNPHADEVLFVLSGDATARISGCPVVLRRDDGLFLTPGGTLAFDVPGPDPLVLASSRCPDPGGEQGFAEVEREDGEGPPPLARLAEQRRETTADRQYNVLVDGAQGSERVTQFVGRIPPGRAPEHYHHYEEVLTILEGQGRMWAGQTSTPIVAGSCVYLPREQPHCVENTGTGPLVLLGVFYPSGSPAVRYDT